MSYQSLLFCPDEKTARVVTQVLTELEFTVELCNEPFATVKKLMAKPYDAIVVDCDNEQNAALLFKSARNSTSNQASLAVAVVEGQVGVAKAFRIGANLVLTKPVNVEQSKGTLRVARGLLRKAAAAAPLGPTTAPQSQPVATRISPTGAVASPPAHVPHYAPAPYPAHAPSLSSSNIPVPAASSSTFEVEEERVPEPEPTEAAFLASIPELPASRMPSHAGTSQTQKESPWLQLPRPIAESKASASADSQQSTEPGATPGRVRHPFNTGLSSGRSAAAAAPARETAPAKLNQSLPEAEPLAASIDLPQRESSEHAPTFASTTNEEKRSKVPVIAALVVIGLAGAGYFGWSKIQTVANPAMANQPAVLQAQPSVAMPEESAKPEPGTTPNPAQAQPLPQLNQNQAESPAAVSSASGKPASDEIVVVENSAPDPAIQAKPLPVKKTHEPLAVKAAPAGDELAIAPPALQAGSNASDQTIAGLITSTSVPVPKRAPEVLRVSQGITQGMLLKKVNPVYPAQALQMRKEGTVQILASITKSGSISSAKVIKGDPILGQAALAAVKQWKYAPYTLDGQPVEVQTHISINFKRP